MINLFNFSSSDDLPDDVSNILMQWKLNEPRFATENENSKYTYCRVVYKKKTEVKYNLI